MRTTPGKAILAGIGAWLLVKIQMFNAYTASVGWGAIDWPAVGSAAISELMTGLIALAALFTRLTSEDEPVAPVVRAEPVPIPAERPHFNYIPEPDKNWFEDWELDCKGRNCNCTYPGHSPMVLAIANDLRERFGVANVNCGYRCPAHNAEIVKAIPGASKTSYHLPDAVTGKSRGIDLSFKDARPHEVYEYLCYKYPNRFGFGEYSNFVHIDDRTIDRKTGEALYGRKAGPGAQWKQFLSAPDHVL